MTSLMHADIFFFVATIGIVLVIIPLVILLVFAVQILSNVRHIVRKGRLESDFILEEIRVWRETSRYSRFGRFGAKGIFELIRNVVSHYRRQ